MRIRFIAFLFLPALLFFSCGKTTPCIDFGKVDLTQICTPDYNPVCGCDDETYQNACYAERNGVVSYILGPCP